MSAFPSQTSAEVEIEFGEEQLACINRSLGTLSETDMTTFWKQAVYHTTLLIFGYGLPVIQGGRFGTLEAVA